MCSRYRWVEGSNAKSWLESSRQKYAMELCIKVEFGIPMKDFTRARPGFPSGFLLPLLNHCSLSMYLMRLNSSNLVVSGFLLAFSLSHKLCSLIDYLFGGSPKPMHIIYLILVGQPLF